MLPKPMNFKDIFDVTVNQSIAEPGVEKRIATIISPADLDGAFSEGRPFRLTVTARKSKSRVGGYNLTYRLNGSVISDLAARLILHNAILA